MSLSYELPETVLREAAQMTDRGSIDPAVRSRIMRQIEAFERALDDAEQNPSGATRARLRAAADELMRAVAATMLELGKQPSP